MGAAVHRRARRWHCGAARAALMADGRAGGWSMRRDRVPRCVRQPELAALNDALSNLAGRGALVVVRGAAGSGKSTLLAAAVHGWRTAGVCVISGRFDRPRQDAATAAVLGFP